MTNKNLPDKGQDKNPKGINPTDRRTNTKPDAADNGELPIREGDPRRAEGTTMDRGNTPKVSNPGRDITTGSNGFDGQGRERMNDQNRDLTKADRAEGELDRENSTQAVQDEQRNAGSKRNKS